MPKSKPSRKKYHQAQVYGNRKIPAKPNWMRITKIIGFSLLAIFMIVAMIGLILKHFRHA